MLPNIETTIGQQPKHSLKVLKLSCKNNAQCGFKEFTKLQQHNAFEKKKCKDKKLGPRSRTQTWTLK
jgi:hypothetical protein